MKTFPNSNSIGCISRLNIILSVIGYRNTLSPIKMIYKKAIIGNNDKTLRLNCHYNVPMLSILVYVKEQF